MRSRVCTRVCFECARVCRLVNAGPLAAPQYKAASSHPWRMPRWEERYRVIEDGGAVTLRSLRRDRGKAAGKMFITASERKRTWPGPAPNQAHAPETMRQMQAFGAGPGLPEAVRGTYRDRCGRVQVESELGDACPALRQREDDGE